MSFSDELKSFRKTKNISQEALARILGVSLMTVNEWETEKRTPSDLVQKGVKVVLDELGMN
jgi:DNA-binding transcriptional regulator YiaG